MPSRISKLISRVGSRSPSGPKKKELGERNRGGFPIAPLCSRSEGCPFNGHPGSRRRNKGSSSGGIIRLRVSSVRNIRGSKVKAFHIIGRKALFLRGIQLPFSMIPHSKKSTSPGLDFMPIFFCNSRKQMGVDKASP